MAVAVAPQWIEPSLRRTEGRDPLGFQTTTRDRLMPLLLPDVLELSRRARYVSFYAFLLREYEARRHPATRDRLSRFIKQREYELGLAILRCPRGCDSSPVGAQRVGPAVQEHPAEFERGESVDSTNGGFGLYYRTPMIAFDVVVPAGTPIGDDGLITIDVLARRDEATKLAAAFRAAVEHTNYFQRYFDTTDAIPVGVIDEYAEAACLCRLDTYPEERDAIESIMLIAPDAASQVAVTQRRRGFAHYLTLLEENPNVVEDGSTFRRMLWDPPSLLSDVHRDVADQWAALVAKDVVQEAFCSMWTHLNRAGLAAGGLDGLTREQFDDVIRAMCLEDPVLEPDAPFADAAESSDVPRNIEDLRLWTRHQNTATSGALALRVLMELVAQRDSVMWRKVADVDSTWQPSVLRITAELERLFDRGPTSAEVIAWLVRRHVVSVHERIAYSKLPDFTFRFRSEPVGLRFYDIDGSRFILSAIRHLPLGSLTRDLGFWRHDGEPQLTNAGRRFIASVLT